MGTLEARVPPPLVALIIGAGMWLASSMFSHDSPPVVPRLIAALAIALVGGAIAAAGASAFRKAKTTINPLRPERSSALVCTGVYRFTRNPMYLGLLLVLLGLSAFLWSLPALLGPLAFVAYLTRFQIAPEERALEEKFGLAFVEYRRRVRRWL